MFEESGELRPVHVPHVTFLNQRDEEPEGEYFRTMQQKLGYDEIHSLHIADFFLVDREGCEDTPQLMVPFTSKFSSEVRVPWEGATQVSFNL